MAKRTAKQSTESRTLAYFKNGIGNWVLMTPALQALASMDASGKIVLVSDSAWEDSRTQAFRDLWAATPWIERVVWYPKETYKGEIARAFYSKHSEGGDALTWFQNLDPNAGNQINWVGTLMHEHDYYMEIVRRLGYRGPVPAQFVPVAEGSVTLDQNIVLCNGAFGKMQTQKHWPHFDELAKVLKLAYPKHQIISVGNGSELRGCPVDVDHVGKLKITETARVLRGAKLVITTDTAVMHIADALKCKTLALFGGTIVSKNGPINGTTVIARSYQRCQPCQYTPLFESCADARCMRELSVGEVMGYVRNIL